MSSEQTPNKVPSGGYLRTQRLAAGLSLREVAAGLGVHHSHLDRIEKGERTATPDLVSRFDEIFVDAAIRKAAS